MSYNKELDDRSFLWVGEPTTKGDGKMEHSNRRTPQQRWQLRNLKTVTTKLPRLTYQRFRDECMLCGMSPYAAMKLLCETATAERLMMLWTRNR